jgi:transposase InsO family protein
MRLEGVSRVHQRREMLEAVQSYGLTVTETAGLWGVSRETFYYWLRRSIAEGEAGLEDRSSVPVRSPGKVPARLEARIVDMRKTHPRWGARRIRTELVRSGVHELPARSTVHRVLVRNGLITVTEKPPAALQRYERAVPNELWQLDGLEYGLSDGITAHIVSVLDDHSRLCGATGAFASENSAAAIAVFDAAVAELGLPYSTLTDRGPAFTGRRTQTVSEFERHLWPLGVVTINGRGYHPQTQGKIERWHRTLREWLDDNGPYATLDKLNAELARFQNHYNNQRPHQGIGDITPAERFAATAPAGPDPDATIDRRQRTTLRSTAVNGNVRYADWAIGLGRAWANTKVRLLDTGDTISIYDAGDTLIATAQPDLTRRYLPTNPPAPT